MLELPAVFPDHLGDVPELALPHPGLQSSIDHLGKPPARDRADGPRGRSCCGQRPGTRTCIAKVSGLNTCFRPGWEPADLEPAVRVAVDAFGPARLVGSDWPVALLNGNYERVWRETTAAIELVAGEAAPGDPDDDATRLYRLIADGTVSCRLEDDR